MLKIKGLIAEILVSGSSELLNILEHQTFSPITLAHHTDRIMNVKLFTRIKWNDQLIHKIIVYYKQEIIHQRNIELKNEVINTVSYPLSVHWQDNLQEADTYL